MEERINYMDKFASPEEYILSELCANRGLETLIYKDRLIELAKENGCVFDENISKKELVVLLADKVSYAKLAEIGNVGVYSTSYQLKFGITHEEVKRMARLGFIKVTGKCRFRAYGKDMYADTYSIYDYFRLTPEGVREWLDKNPKGKRKGKMENKDEV